MTAKYDMIVRAKNNANDSVPVVVYADSVQEAMKRAVALGWIGDNCLAIVLKVEEVRDCGCG